LSNFRWNPAVYQEAVKLAGRGLEAATVFLKNAVKETLSVPAPRIAVVDRTGARRYVAGFKLNDPRRWVTPYIKGAKEATITSFKFPKRTKGVQGAMFGPPQAQGIRYQTAPAIKGDPPRKLSGRLRAGVAHEMLDPMKTFEGGAVATKGRVGTNVKYARRLEFGPGGHKFLERTLAKYQPEIEAIIDRTI